MVGNRGKRSRSKSKFKALALAPEEPEPLNIIHVETADGPYGKLQKKDIFNSDVMPVYGARHEEGIGNEINDTIVDGHEAVLTNADTEEEDIGDGDDAGTDMEFENNDEVTYEEESEEDMSDGDDGATDMDPENINEITNEEETEEYEKPISYGSENEEDEEEEEEDREVEEEDGEDVEEVREEELEEEVEEEVEEEEGEDEELIEAQQEEEDDVEEEEGEDEELIEAQQEEEEEDVEEEEQLEEDVTDGYDAGTNVNVENSNERTNEEEAEKDDEKVSCGSDNEDVHSGEEKMVDINAWVTNTNDGSADPEYVLVEKSTDNLDDDEEANELSAEEPLSLPAENGGNESIKQIASTANDVKTVAEKVIGPENKITRRKVIKKKISPGKVVTVVNEGKLKTSDGNEGSGVSGKVGTSSETEPQNSDGNEAMGVANGEGRTKNLKHEEKVRGKQIVKINKKMNMKKVSQNPKSSYDEPASEEKQSIEQDIKNEEGEKSKAGLSRLNNRKNKKVVEDGAQNVDTKDIDHPESSKNGKSSKRVASMGMIFMCSSSTKNDCFRYNVFGLPAAKKDIVSKIYKGMRLFLYDVDLKLLYGIYKAAGRGGYDVEPRAFKSQFPAQVRFSVLKNCVPVPEEKFKKVIKGNYYSKNKFNCQLTNEQVKSLFKLFQETRKKSESKSTAQHQRPVATSFFVVDRKRKRAEDSRRMAPGAIISSRDYERRRKRPIEIRCSPIVRRREEASRGIPVRGREETRLAPMIIDERIERYHHPVLVYDRESYLPSIESSALYHPLRGEDPARSRIYSYRRDPEVDTYRRESAIDYRDLGLPGSRESRHYVQQNRVDPYAVTYRESQVYREPVYETDNRRERYIYTPAEECYAEHYRSDDYPPPASLRPRY